MSETKRVACGLCYCDSIRHATLCRDCDGIVVYGPTQWELAEPANIWSIVFGLIAVFLLFVLPSILNWIWNVEIPLGWDFGEWGLLGICVALFCGNSVGTYRADKTHFRQVRIVPPV